MVAHEVPSASPRTAEPPAAPREVPRWARSSAARTLRLTGMVLVLMALVATTVLRILTGSPFADRALDARGVVVRATPVDVHLSATTRGGAVDIYDIELAFTDARGEHRTRVTAMDEDQLAAARAGAAMDVEVDPQDPRVSRWPGERLAPVGMAIYYLGGAVAGFGLLVVVFGGVRGLRDRRLYRHGQARLGRIDEVEPFVENQRTNYRITYSFQTQGGRNQETWVARGVIAAEPGPIWVIVDPTDEGRSVPVLDG